MPIVSIITCTYNRAHLIGETIRNILNQTFSNFEYLIVDEDSQDNTEEVIKSFADIRIKYYKIANTGGHLSKLRNFGMSKSNGKYIAFVDSDDLWTSEKLALQVNALEKDSTLGFSFTDIEIFNSAGIVKKSLYGKSGNFRGFIFEEFIKNKFVICATTLFFRKECAEAVGYEDESLLSGDYDFIVALASRYNAFAIYTPLVRVRKHPENTTSHVDAHLTRMEGYFKTLQKVLDRGSISIETYNQIRTNIYYAFGIQMMNAKQYNRARHFFWKNICANPMAIKPWIRLMLTLPK